MARKEKKQRRREDAIFNVVLWISVVVLLSGAGAVWYMIVRFMRCVEAITSRMIGGPVL